MDREQPKHPELTLQYRNRISRRQATEMIGAFAIFGDYMAPFPRPKTMEETGRLLMRLGIDSNRLIEDCRDWRNHVPYFENLMGSTFRTIGGPKVSLVDRLTGEETPPVTGPAVITASVYQSRLEAAAAARDRAVESDSFEEYQGAVVKGIAAIEAFIADRASQWNAQNPSAKLIDSKAQKVSLDDKIDEWIPTMTNGGRIDKGDQRWQHFTELRRIRDRDEVHPKGGGHLVELQTLADQINMFRSGIGGMLAQLHATFRVLAPRVQIRSMYMPDVEVVETPQAIP